jgi:tRNA pseudouridine55 synthase
VAQQRLDGVFVVDKPARVTSHDVVGTVRRVVRQATGGTRKSVKVGHAGTLDPAATGVLLVCVGKATRLVPYLQASRKTYEAGVMLGVTTTTLDAEGEVIEERDASAVTERDVCETLKRFVGDIEQVPPMVSALKVDGERLYEKARRGETVERRARPVTIHDLVLEEFVPGTRPVVDILVTCSKGTYVRTLAEDIGARLGVGGHLTSLRRLASGRFDIGDAVTPDELAARGEAEGPDGLADLMLTMAEAVGDYPARPLDGDETVALRHGRFLAASGHDGPVAALGPDGDLVAMVEDQEGRARPLAVLAP